MRVRGFFMSIYDNYMFLIEKIDKAAQSAGKNAGDIALVGATKMQSVQKINEAITAGLRFIGENKVQELTAKYDLVDKPDGFEYHFIGALQKNKIKYLFNKVSLIQSVDSTQLAKEMDRMAQKNDAMMPVLLEVNIAGEPSKAGFLKEELDEAVCEIGSLPRLEVRGLMTIPPMMDEQNRLGYRYFTEMYNLFVDIKGKKYDNVHMNTLSMGMSDDFEKAIESGSNMVRIGSALFGQRG